EKFPLRSAVRTSRSLRSSTRSATTAPFPSGARFTLGRAPLCARTAWLTPADTGCVRSVVELVLIPSPPEQVGGRTLSPPRPVPRAPLRATGRFTLARVVDYVSPPIRGGGRRKNGDCKGHAPTRRCKGSRIPSPPPPSKGGWRTVRRPGYRW